MRHLVLVALLLIASCTEPELESPTVESEIDDDPADDPGCPGWKCSGNSPIMGPWGPFTDFRQDGQFANSAGLRVDGLWKDGVRYEPRVVGARLTAKLGDELLEGDELEQSYLRIATPLPLVAYKLWIERVNQTVTYWHGPPTTLETYELTYSVAAVSRTPLCNNPPSSSSGDGQLWTAPLEAILFTGDRYGIDKKIFASTYAESAGWFTIGCAGSAIAKLVLNRFATVGSIGLYQSTRAERQDVLSMYTGNVCGTGRAFTVPDTAITWESSAGWHGLNPHQTWESVWGGGRAQCLDTWRLEDTHPGIRDKIASECPLPPSCTTSGWFPLLWTSRGTVRSANP